ncbi:hypothetical protein ABH927_002058 [Planotetraspora sp. GP83]
MSVPAIVAMDGVKAPDVGLFDFPRSGAARRTG